MTKKVRYENPPVVERILNVQFEPLRGMNNGHLGAFWKFLGAEWSTAKDAPAVEPQFEGFTEEDRWHRVGLTLSMAQAPTIRLQITNADGDRMIQIQNGRLIFNWIKQEGRKYPDYETVRAGFASALSRFQDFANSELLGPVVANQWEITYLNHMARGSVWTSVDDWSFFRPIGSARGIEGMTTLESLSQRCQYLIGDNRGRLHVTWQHAKKNDDGQEMVVLNLTARGPVPERKSDGGSLLAGLDIGHDAIVQTFVTFMSADANRYWGINDAAV